MAVDEGAKPARFDRHMGRVGAAFARRDQAVGAIPRPPCGDARADGLDDPGDIVAQDQGELPRPLELQQALAVAAGTLDVDRVHRGGLDPQHDLALAGTWNGHGFDRERRRFGRGQAEQPFGQTHAATTRVRCSPRSSAPSSVRMLRAMTSLGCR
ncbi:hypothetical protein D3C78_1458600 [compost metagenome]